MRTNAEPKVDFIFAGGNTEGSVAKRLMANGFDTESLRTNDTLLYDDWKAIDEVVIQIATKRLVGIGDLFGRNLVYRIGNGLAKTVLAYQDASDMEDAQVSMDGITRGRRDRPEFDINYLPLPIIHADFSFSIREIQQSRNGNQPLDIFAAGVAARKVAELAESILCQGYNSFTHGGGTIQGYEDFTHRNSYTISVAWTASAATGAVVVADVLGMKQASIDDRHYGPWVLYIPTNYETKMDEDYSTSKGTDTIRERILAINNISDIKVLDYLTASNVMLVELDIETVRIVEGLPITTVQWDTEGGMQTNFKVMAILVPQLRADQDNRCGIIHGKA